MYPKRWQQNAIQQYQHTSLQFQKHRTLEPGFSAIYSSEGGLK